MEDRHADMMKLIMDSAGALLQDSDAACHDITHALRVRDLCAYIGRAEGGDMEVLEASALLHDIGRTAEMKKSGADHAAVSAELAPAILGKSGFPAEKIAAVVYAIENHRYSSNIIPDSLEARILQDADRLDISGAVGIAMTFCYSGARSRMMYHPSDPLALGREPNGGEYAIDHILSKLMTLPEHMHTATARHLAEQRNTFLKAFVEQFVHEVAFNRGPET